jgi:hypothetical protein
MKRHSYLPWLIAAMIAIVAFGSGLALAPVQRDAPAPIPRPERPPDARVFAVVLSTLEQEHLSRHRTASPWHLSIDPARGTIESTWYSDHKGEVWLKVQAVVFGPHFRIDVFQRVWLFSRYATRTEWSSRVEVSLQESISKALHEELNP